eukprot:jgi/Psemu1/64805/estExt_Genemark1.C_840034
MEDSVLSAITIPVVLKQRKILFLVQHFHIRFYKFLSGVVVSIDQNLHLMLSLQELLRRVVTPDLNLRPNQPKLHKMKFLLLMNLPQQQEQEGTKYLHVPSHQVVGSDSHHNSNAAPNPNAEETYTNLSSSNTFCFTRRCGLRKTLKICGKESWIGTEWSDVCKYRVCEGPKSGCFNIFDSIDDQGLHYNKRSNQIPDSFPGTVLITDTQNVNSENRYQLHKDYQQKNSPEFLYFMKRLLGAVSPKQTDFKRKSFRTVVTFALLFLYKDNNLWLNTTKGKRKRKKFSDSKSGNKEGWSAQGRILYKYVLSEIEKQRKEQQLRDLEIELLKMYQHGKHTLQDDEDKESKNEEQQRRKEQECDTVETLGKDDEDCKFYIQCMKSLPEHICDPKPSKSPFDLANAQVDWVLSKGGSFDTTKIAIQPIDVKEGSKNCSPDSNLGLFAANDIQQGDLLIQIPAAAILKGEFDESRCDGTLTLLQEITKGRDATEFAPYLEYLYSKEGILSIPSMWSSAGRNLLKTIHGPNLKPHDMVDTSFVNDCIGKKDEVEIKEEETLQQVEFAYATMLSRSMDESLVPLVDMINHNVDFNVEIETTKGSDDTEDPDVVEVHAASTIHKGEQLYINYRRRDRDGIRQTAHLLRNFGFVEEYPQRWVLPTPPRRSNIDENNVPHEIIFDVVRVEDGKDYEIEWFDPTKPILFDFVAEHLQKEMDRIAEIEPLVIQITETLTSENERKTILQYYRSLIIAYKIVIASIEKAIDTMPAPVENPGDKFMACSDFEALYDETDGWEFMEGSYSSHQGVDFYYNEEKKDVCLFLEEYLHACLSNRPHYHEVFVHYPAHFLEKVERVLFIGGGDSMVLHEVLKYDQLELVVGLELDQHVVRSSFAHMGTQPHFHNDKVQWWFGDAAVALNALPTDYYGTFDLVVVDILSEVAEMLQVNEELTIMEAAMMLMKPNGIIVKNEDEGYVPGSTKSTAFPENTVDVVYYDVPVYCLQTFVVGSNYINFSETKPMDHKVSTFYLKGVHEFQSQFDTWYSSGTTLDGVETQAESNDDDSNQSPTPSPSVIGLTMIIEAEDVTIALEPSSNVREIIDEKLGDLGFTTISSFDAELSDGYTLISLLEEGCITARCFTAQDYCAVDVQLWKSVHQAESIKKALLSGLGSRDSSVFRVITTGIYGVEENNNNPKIGPPPKKFSSRQQEKYQSDVQTTFKERKDLAIDFKNATTNDFDSTSALAQWESQEPWGLQNITKYELPFTYGREKLSRMLCEVLEESLTDLLEEWEHQDKDQIVVAPHNVGDGVVVIATWSEGTLIFVWDGMSRVDMNIFSLEESAWTNIGSVRAYFRKYIIAIASDEFPRGTGRIINAREDFVSDEEEGEGDESRPRPFWAPSLA